MNTIVIAVVGVGLICLAACGGPDEMAARSASTQSGSNWLPAQLLSSLTASAFSTDAR